MKRKTRSVVVGDDGVLNKLASSDPNVCLLLLTFLSLEFLFTFSKISKFWRNLCLLHIDRHFTQFYNYHAKTWENWDLVTPYPWLVGVKKWSSGNTIDHQEDLGMKTHRPSFVLWTIKVILFFFARLKSRNGMDKTWKTMLTPSKLQPKNLIG